MKGQVKVDFCPRTSKIGKLEPVGSHLRADPEQPESNEQGTLSLYSLDAKDQ